MTCWFVMMWPILLMMKPDPSPEAVWICTTASATRCTFFSTVIDSRPGSTKYMSSLCATDFLAPAAFGASFSIREMSARGSVKIVWPRSTTIESSRSFKTSAWSSEPFLSTI